MAGWYPQVGCAVSEGDDCCGYTLTCDKGLYVPAGIFADNDTSNITTVPVNVTLPAPDPSRDAPPPPPMVEGFKNATMTCQTCPQGDAHFDTVCSFGIPEGIRPKAGSPSDKQR